MCSTREVARASLYDAVVTMPLPRATKAIALSRDSHVAMHRQLADRLRDAIAQGIYQPGEKIPTEPQLINRFEVSRITVRQAVDALAKEGLVIRQQGKGTFVAGPVVHHDLQELRGIYDQLVAQGHTPNTSLLEFKYLVPAPAIAQRLASGSRRLLCYQRLYELRGSPFAVTTVHLDPGEVRITREQARRHMTYSILENLLGKRIGRADVTIRYERASTEYARLLQLQRGAPLMVFDRVSYDHKGVPLEHSDYRARAQAYEFSLKVSGKLPITQSLKAQR